MSLPKLKQFLLTALCALGVCLGASDVFAQDVSDEDVERFQSHLKEGGALVEKGEYQDGIVELKTARRIVDHPKITLSIASAYRKWGRCGRAKSEYERLLAREDLDDELRAKATNGLETIDECIDTGTLSVTCSPDAAQVAIDGGEAKACPFEGDVKVGSHAVAVRADGFEAKTETVTIEPDETTQVSISLRPSATAKPVADASDDVEQPEDQDPEWLPYASYGAMGLGGALIVGGVINDMTSVGRTNRLAEAQRDGDTQRIAELESSADAARVRSIVFYTTGVVIAGAGVALQFIELGAPEKNRNPYASAPRVKTRVFFTGTGVSASMTW